MCCVLRISSLLPLMLHFVHLGASSALQTLRFATPGLCTSNHTFHESFLMSQHVVRYGVECASKCAQDDICRSYVVSGKSPNIECRLYDHGTNRYGVYLQPDPQAHYMEKLGVSMRGTGEHCMEQDTRNPKDPNGPCAYSTAWMYVGEWLRVGERICSFNLQYHFLLRPEDGNLVTLDMATGALIWSSAVSPPGFPSHHATLLPDGNLVIRDAQGNVGWSSNSPCSPLLFVVLRGLNGALAARKSIDNAVPCWEIIP